MKNSIKEKLKNLIERYEEVKFLLNNLKNNFDQKKVINLSKEYYYLNPIISTYKRYSKALIDRKIAYEILNEKDSELIEIAKEDIRLFNELIEKLENKLQILLLPRDYNDNINIFLEIRAGTGGVEASIFSADLLKMYLKYAEQKGWNVKILSSSVGERGGYKEIILKVYGHGVYSRLKFESGSHRVQRVPFTESQGRIHTSTCTVAVLPELDKIKKININSTDLKIDTFRSSGAGGQHVNKTDSAVRITHIPTGIVIECQDHRSQHKNRATAMSILKSKLLQEEIRKQEREKSNTRKILIGSGDRSERIRTYNYPHGRVTDHRINLTYYKLHDFMNGNLDIIINTLILEHQTNFLLNVYNE